MAGCNSTNVNTFVTKCMNGTTDINQCNTILQNIFFNEPDILSDCMVNVFFKNMYDAYSTSTKKRLDVFANSISGIFNLCKSAVSTKKSTYIDVRCYDIISSIMGDCMNNVYKINSLQPPGNNICYDISTYFSTACTTPIQIQNEGYCIIFLNQFYYTFCSVNTSDKGTDLKYLAHITFDILDGNIYRDFYKEVNTIHTNCGVSYRSDCLVLLESNISSCLNPLTEEIIPICNLSMPILFATCGNKYSSQCINYLSDLITKCISGTYNYDTCSGMINVILKYSMYYPNITSDDQLLYIFNMCVDNQSDGCQNFIIYMLSKCNTSTKGVNCDKYFNVIMNKCLKDQSTSTFFCIDNFIVYDKFCSDGSYKSNICQSYGGYILNLCIQSWEEICNIFIVSGIATMAISNYFIANFPSTSDAKFSDLYIIDSLCKKNILNCNSGLKVFCSQFYLKELHQYYYKGVLLPPLQQKLLQLSCGCYLNPSYYKIPKISTYCDPICSRSDLIPSSCASDICIIYDDWIFMTAETDIRKMYNKQTCSDCYFADTTIDIVNSYLKEGPKIADFCTNCFDKSSNKIDCTTGIEEEILDYIKSHKIYIILFVVLLIIFIIIIL